MGVVLVISGVVHQSQAPGDVCLLQLVGRDLGGEQRWPWQGGEPGSLHITQQRQLERPLQSTGDLDASAIAGSPHAIEERVGVGHRILVVLSIVAQTKKAEPYLTRGTYLGIEAPALQELGRSELHVGMPSTARRDAGLGIERGVGGDPILVLGRSEERRVGKECRSVWATGGRIE